MSAPAPAPAPAPVPTAAATGTVSKTNQDLWKDLMVKLKEYIAQGEEIGSDVKIYVPTFNSQAIPAGDAVDNAITNFAVFQTGDNLLPPDSPIFTPGNQSYIRTISSYLNWVKTEPLNDAGALQVLEKAQRDSDQAADDYISIAIPKAQKAYKSITGKDSVDIPEIEAWAMSNYPSLAVARGKMQANATSYYSILAKVKGPVATSLEKDRANITLAQTNNLATMFNMLCSTDPAPSDKKLPLTDRRYRPLYNLQSTYKGQVQGWINASLQDKKSNMFSVSFNSTNSASQEWRSLGYENINVNANANWWFVSARFNVSGEEKTETIDSGSSSERISCVLSARNYGVFNISPDSTWDNANIAKEYELLDGAPTDLLTPMYRISTILVGYQVSLKISMGSTLYQSLKETYNKAFQANGSISIMGFNVSANYSSGKSTSFSSVKMSDNDFSIEIPASNSSYPVLLGAIGRRTGGEKAKNIFSASRESAAQNVKAAAGNNTTVPRA